MGCSQKYQTGSKRGKGLKTWKFQGYWRKSFRRFQGSIKKEVEYPVVLKKTTCLVCRYRDRSKFKIGCWFFFENQRLYQITGTNQNFICCLYFYVIFLLTCDILVTLGVAQYFSVFLFCGSFRVSCCGSNPKSIRAVFHFLFWWKFTGSSIQFVIFEWMAASCKVGSESHWRWHYQWKTNKYR